MISLIVAMDNNNVIGSDNDMPWHLPNDLKHFKEKTTNKTVVMGRKTYEAIGKALPNRKNVILTRQEDTYPSHIKVIHDIEPVQTYNEEYPETEVFVIGGENIFRQFLPYADRMYITLIDEHFSGDTYFPDFSDSDWTLTAKEKGEKNEKNPYDYYFLQYDRK